MEYFVEANGIIAFAIRFSYSDGPLFGRSIVHQSLKRPSFIFSTSSFMRSTGFTIFSFDTWIRSGTLMLSHTHTHIHTAGIKLTWEKRSRVHSHRSQGSSLAGNVFGLTLHLHKHSWQLEVEQGSNVLSLQELVDWGTQTS